MHRRRSSGGRGGEGDPWPARFGAKKHKDEFENTCNMGDFRAHIFCPQMTQELPKKHYEAGLPEQLPTTCIVTNRLKKKKIDTVKIAKRFACANEQLKGRDTTR